MKLLAGTTFSLCLLWASGFQPPSHAYHSLKTKPLSPWRENWNCKPSTLSSFHNMILCSQMTNDADSLTDNAEDMQTKKTATFLTISTMALLLGFALPAGAATMTMASAGDDVILSALWAYGHYFSILAITACLVAERVIVQPGMSSEDEEAIVKIDLFYGLMAALLIVSGFARASVYGKGGDFYLHETLFWVKMTLSGIWGGLSLFPSLTFYKRKQQRQDNGVDSAMQPIPDALVKRLQSVIVAELSAILSIPLLATLMSRGVGYWRDFPWQVGMVVSIAATGGSFFYYGNQALAWPSEEGDQENKNGEAVSS